MSLQVCSCCGWSKVTTYHGLRTHQGKMGCTPRGVTVTESEQQFMWGHVELTNNQKDIELDDYAYIKTGYYYSDMGHQVCHCGWSKVTTYHGLRTHQGMMGCTPKGMRIPKEEQYKWNNRWGEADKSKYQPAKRETVKKENVPRSPSTISHTVSAAITGRAKVEYNSSFSTPQRSSKKASKSRSQLQDFCTLPQGRTSDREPPTPAYPETVVRPKKNDRRDQTLSQVCSYTDPPTAATINGEPESPIPHRSSKKATTSKSGHQLQDFYTPPQVNTSVREHPAPTYPVPVEERKKKERREQTLSQVTKLAKERPPIPPKVTAVRSEEKDMKAGKVRPTDVKHKIQMREPKVDQGRSFVKVRQGSVDAEWLEIKSVFSEVVRVAEDAQQKPLGLSLSTLRTTTSNREKMEKMSSIVNVKLDPTTAHRCLVSADGKKVSNGGGNQEAPGRFGNVLGLNRLTSGKS